MYDVWWVAFYLLLNKPKCGTPGQLLSIEETFNFGEISQLSTFLSSQFPSLPLSQPPKNYVFHLKLFWNWKIKKTKPVKILHYVMHVFFFKIGHTLTKIWQNIDFIVHFFSSNVCPWVFLQRTHVDVQCLASFPLPCSILKGPTEFASWNPSDLSQIYSKCVTNLFHVYHTFIANCCVSSSGLAFKHLLSIQILRTTSNDDISKHLKGRSLSRVSVSRFRTRDFVLFLFLDTFQKKSQLFFLIRNFKKNSSLTNNFF